jgi:hypothetical protein
LDLVIPPEDNTVRNVIDCREDHEVPVVENLGLEEQIERG